MDHRPRARACGFAGLIAPATLSAAGYATHAEAHTAARCARLYALDHKETRPCPTPPPTPRRPLTYLCRTTTA